MNHKEKVWKCVVWNHLARTGAGRPKNRGLIPCMVKKISPLLNCSRTALEPDKPLIQWGLEAIFPGIRRPEREDDHSLLVLRLRIRGVTRPLPNTPLWRVEIHRLAFTTSLRGGTNTSVLPTYGASTQTGASNLSPQAASTEDAKMYRQRYEPHTAKSFRQEV
jgi:hypothetical protein